MAIGDVHASYDKFLALLRGTGLVNEGSNWTGGTAHLVLAGDLVDRGQDDRKVMDLAMRAQTKAQVATRGESHALLGNHDLMVLMRDLRYVEKKSYAAFAPDENPEDRVKGWAGYVTAYPADRAGDPKLRAAFDDSYPPGFFAYLRMLDLEGPYGAWALARPAVIKVNGIVFVHGGLTEKVAAKGLEGINREMPRGRRRLRQGRQSARALIKGPATFGEISAVAYDIDKGAFKGKKDPGQDEAAKALIACLNSPLRAQDSAVWYRGNSLESEVLERRRIDAVLDLLKASTLVVGHTPTAQGLVTSRFGARVYRADVGQAYGRQPYCLEFKGGEVRVFDPQKAAYGSASAEKPQGQKWTTMQPQMTDRQLEEYLKKAAIEAKSDLRIEDRTVRVLELDLDGLKFRALFLPFEEKLPAGKTEAEVRLRRYQHEVAAYWLDRRLKLRMVPVTVVRTVDGKRGALQIWIESAVDRVWVEEQKSLDKVREELKDEIDKAWVLGRIGRGTPGQEEPEGVDGGPPRHALGKHPGVLRSPEIPAAAVPHLRCPINPSLENELRTLTREELKKGLKDYLSDGQIDAAAGTYRPGRRRSACLPRRFETSVEHARADESVCRLRLEAGRRPGWPEAGPGRPGTSRPGIPWPAKGRSRRRAGSWCSPPPRPRSIWSMTNSSPEALTGLARTSTLTPWMRSLSAMKAEFGRDQVPAGHAGLDRPDGFRHELDALDDLGRAEHVGGDFRPDARPRDEPETLRSLYIRMSTLP